jgi:hypothetical protein
MQAPKHNKISPYHTLPPQMQRDAFLLKMASNLTNLHKNLIAKIESLNKVGPKGDTGLPGKPGKDGKSPTIQDVLKLLTPLIETIKNELSRQVPTVDEVVEKVKPLLPTLPKLKNVKTPVRGVDYFTEDDISVISDRAAQKISIKNVAVDPMAIIDEIMKLPDGKKLTAKHIDGLEQTISAIQHQLRRGYLHGSGVPSLTAGSNITLTKTSDGGFIISSTGGGATNVIIGEIPNAVQSGNNVILTLAHYPTQQAVYWQGQRRDPLTYSISGNIITFYNANATDSFQVDYTYDDTQDAIELESGLGNIELENGNGIIQLE